MVTGIAHRYITSFFNIKGLSFSINCCTNFQVTLECLIHLESSYYDIKKCVNQVIDLVTTQSFNSVHQIINKGHLVLMQHDKVPHSLKDFPTCQLHIDAWKLRCYVINIFVTQTMIHAIHIIFAKNEPTIQA